MIPLVGPSPRSLWLLVAVFASGPSLHAAAPPEADGLEFFEKKIRPVLVEHCYKCHSGEGKKARGGLQVDGRQALLRGGDSGPALVPGQPQKSRLIEAIGYGNVDLRMPPKYKLPDDALADLTAWVKMGAPWPETPGTNTSVKDDFDLQKRKKEHWAWQPVRSQPLPAVKDTTWPLDPIDHFVLAKLEAKDLRPARPTEARILLRRLHFDLIGLPPTPAEIATFEQAAAQNLPQALEQTVDRLLQSPHFGERWGRHWLDLVRYADSRGHEFDFPIPNAYQYRDYVIRSLNADVPYDQFVKEHLAGDLLAKPRRHPKDGFNESVLGTGFWFLGEEVHSPVDIRQDQADRFDNRIDVMTKTFLGLTVACARCHDHKFDAISTKDYYALFGFLESSSYRQVRFDTQLHNQQVAEELRAARRAAAASLQQTLMRELQPTADRLADHLLLARKVILAGKDSEPTLQRLAKEQKLNADLVRRWVEYLRKAQADARDPFHFWARVCHEAKADDPAQLASLLRAQLESERSAASTPVGALPVPLGAGFYPDGEAFESVHAGDIRLSGTLTSPLVDIVEHDALHKDAVWDRLGTAGGAENDPGALGGVMRAGRTFATPNFTIQKDRVFYRVKGSGKAYVAVGQHAVIAGPLHGEIVQPFDTGGQVQWLSQDVRRYRGLPAHLEFTAGAGHFQVLDVVQADQPPPAVRAIPWNANLAKHWQGSDDKSPRTVSLADLAGAYATQFGADALNWFSCPDRHAASRGGAFLPAVQWLLGHRDLYLVDRAATEARLSKQAQPLLAEQLKIAEKIRPQSRLAPAMMEGSGLDGHVFIRGSHKAPGPKVPRRLLEALVGAQPLQASQGGSGRLQLAEQITDPTINPFLARVLVNRLWHHLLGRGIVSSVDNFGVLGERPSHPELLDHLADRLVREGWSIKKMIRVLVLTQTYRMASEPMNARAEEIDPNNLLLHRANLRRLEGEAIRDALLTVSGRLNPKMHGPSVLVHLTPFMEGRGRPDSGPVDGDGRRSVYLAVRRNFLSPFLLAFDTPIPFSTVGRRAVSNVPAQALILLNDPFVHQQAQLWAQKLLAQDIPPRERIQQMYLAAFGRMPSGEELRACLAFLHEQEQQKVEAQRAWTDLAHVLFNTKEFIYLN